MHEHTQTQTHPHTHFSSCLAGLRSFKAIKDHVKLNSGGLILASIVLPGSLKEHHSLLIKLSFKHVDQ